MPKLTVNKEILLMALDDHSLEHSHYLDLQTGNILFFSDYGDNDEEALARLEEDPDRFLTIEPVESHEAFHYMEEFVVNLPEGKARLSLSRALSGKKPFRRFKDALAEFPDLRDQWFAFQDQALLRYAKEWLEDEGVDAELTNKYDG
jgi:hypothetical protein